MTNFVVAGSHSKHRHLNHVSFYRQLQTSWLDLFTQFVWVVLRVISFCWSYEFYLSIIIIVGRDFTSNNASKENNSSILLLNHFTKLQRMKGKLGGGGGLWLIKMECPILFSAPPPPTFYFSLPPLLLLMLLALFAWCRMQWSMLYTR